MLDGQTDRGALSRAWPSCKLDLGGQAVLFQSLDRSIAHAPSDVVAQVRDAGCSVDAMQLSAFRTDEWPGRCRLDLGFDPAAAAGIEAGRDHVQGQRHAERRQVGGAR